MLPLLKKYILLQSDKCKKKKNKRMIRRKLDAVKIYTNISFDKLYIVIECVSIIIKVGIDLHFIIQICNY